MNKENIKKIIQVMEVLEGQIGKGADTGKIKVTSDYLKNRFVSVQYGLYLTYCENMFCKIGHEEVHTLTSEGIHELNRLRQELRQIGILEQQTLFNKLLTFFTAFVAVGVVFSYTVGKDYSPLAALIATFAIVGSTVLLYVLGKSLVKTL